MTLYFEDMAPGRQFETGGHVLTREEMVTFAERFDPQPFHVDETAARESMFGGLVASGLHTLCLSWRLFILEVVQGEEGIAMMGGSGMDDLRWPRPVRPGETVRVEAEVADRSRSDGRPDRGYVDFHLSALVDAGEVLSVESHNIVERARPDG